MIKRGLYKHGYYLSILESLELNYQLQEQIHGYDYRKWKPLPIRRPDYFLRITDIYFESKHVVIPQSFDGYIHELEIGRLTHVAQILAFSVRKYFARNLLVNFDQSIGIARLKKLISQPGKSRELFPQTRKYAKYLRNNLDPLWLVALQELDQKENHGSFESQIIGGLPPSFKLHYEHILPNIVRHKFNDELSMMQFYGLVTGKVPEIRTYPLHLIEELSKFSQIELSLVNMLSLSQLKQLCSLSSDTYSLVLMIRGMRRSSSAWRDIIARLLDIIESEKESPKAGIRLLRHFRYKYAIDIKSIDDIKSLAQPQEWRQVQGLDEEIIRLIDKGSINYKFFGKLSIWNAQLQKEIKKMLEVDWPWIVEYLNDLRFLETQRKRREPIILNTKDIFPKSIDYLDAKLRQNHGEYVFHNITTIYDNALLYSEELNKLVFKGNKTNT